MKNVLPKVYFKLNIDYCLFMVLPCSWIWSIATVFHIPRKEAVKNFPLNWRLFRSHYFLTPHRQILVQLILLKVLNNQHFYKIDNDDDSNNVQSVTCFFWKLWKKVVKLRFLWIWKKLMAVKINRTFPKNWMLNNEAIKSSTSINDTWRCRGTYTIEAIANTVIAKRKVKRKSLAGDKRGIFSHMTYFIFNPNKLSE